MSRSAAVRKAARMAEAEAAIEAAKPTSAPTPTPAPPPLESGLGNLSAEDKAAIMGHTPGSEPVMITPEGDTHFLTATEMLTSGAPFGGEATMGDPAPAIMPPISPSDDLIGRVLMLEGRMTDLEKALEQWADRMNRMPAPQTASRLLVESPVRPATPEEEAAYCRVNHDRSMAGEKPFDGIEAWRAAGSPGVAA